MTDDEFEKLKKFMGLFYEWLMAKPNTSPEVHPLIVMQGIEQKSRARAQQGLKMAINDMLELTADWPPEVVALADEAFRQHGAPTLSEVRGTSLRKYRQILKRGRIKTEVEYYLIKGVLDGSVVELGPDDVLRLDAMLTDFEGRVSLKAGG